MPKYPEMTPSSIAKHRAYNKQYMKAKTALYKKLGLCLDCMNPSLVVRCRECYLKARRRKMNQMLMNSLKKYKSHKIVRAAKIKKVYDVEDTNVVALTFEGLDESLVAQFTTEELVKKPEPLPGMYMIVYDDGYVSFSPEQAFISGYTEAYTAK